MTRIALVAGEASGDQLGAGLIEAARRLRPDLEFAGIAGPAMRAAGCEEWFAADELSVMGLAEVIRHLPRIAGIGRRLTQRLRSERPAVFVGIDSPDFNLRVAARVRTAGIKTVQYVCPSVWAWRQGRVRVLRRACDRVLCLLPFEAPFLEARGVPAVFVGHPFADQIPAMPDTGPARRSLGLRATMVVGLLPGSRLDEISRLGPVFLQTALRLQHDLPGLGFAVALASPAIRRAFERLLPEHGVGLDLKLVDGQAREVIAASDVVLLASGTVTLEAMLIGRPMVVAYRMAPVTYWTARSLDLVKVPYFALPNLLAGEALVPEILQGQVTPGQLARSVRELLDSPQRCDFLRSRFAELSRGLRRGASGIAARAVLEVGGFHPPS
jgi:lipid-A-disaccharide synthase